MSSSQRRRASMARPRGVLGKRAPSEEEEEVQARPRARARARASSPARPSCRLESLALFSRVSNNGSSSNHSRMRMTGPPGQRALLFRQGQLSPLRFQG